MRGDTISEYTADELGLEPVEFNVLVQLEKKALKEGQPLELYLMRKALEPAKVFMAVMSEPYPETRVDHNAIYHEVIGLYDNETKALVAIELHKIEAAKDAEIDLDNFDMYFEEREYDVSERKVK